MAKRDLTKIEIHTLPNGYSLSIDGGNFMYYNELDLLAGFMSHVGMSEEKAMDKATMLSSLMSAMLGQTYTEQVATLKQRVGLLSSQYETTISRMDQAVEYVTQAEKAITGMQNRLKAIEDKLKATEDAHAKNQKIVDEAAKKLEDIEKNSNAVMNSLANSATILKAMENVKQVQEMPGDSETGDQETADTKPKKRGRGGRNKAADAQIAAEIEKKAKENPNIK